MSKNECANPYCDLAATVAIQVYGKTVAHTCDACARPLKPEFVEITSEEDT